MLKKIVLVIAIFSSSMFSNDMLTGDTKLSCEAILCLSTSSRPSECSPSIKKYFSISYDDWSDTVKARGDFLKLCPVGNAAEQDNTFTDLRDNILPFTDPRQCTADYLNQQVEIKGANPYNGDSFYLSENAYRINPTTHSQCNKLYNHAYTDIKKPTYNCSGEFYSEVEWNMSAKLVAIPRSEYNKLSNKDRHQIDYSEGEGYTIYYKKVPFSKTCWEDQIPINGYETPLISLDEDTIEGCSLKDLNTTLEEEIVHIGGESFYGKIDEKINRIRISPNPNTACKQLINNPNATKKPKYICSEKVFIYSEEEWETGLKVASMALVENIFDLPFEERGRVETIEKNGKTFNVIINRTPIDKTCWVWDK